MKLAYILTCMALLSSTAQADDWTPSNTAWEAAFIAATIVDCGQTRDISRRPAYEGYYEHNTIIGRNPSVGRIDKYFSAVLIGHFAVSYVLPKKYRETWQKYTTVSQVAIIAHNHYIGLRVDF
jgi:hypothetical protein